MELSSKKGKEIPIQAWAGRECSRRLRFPDFEKMGTCEGGEVVN